MEWKFGHSFLICSNTHDWWVEFYILLPVLLHIPSVFSFPSSFFFKKRKDFEKETENNLILMLRHLTSMYLNSLVSGLNRLNLTMELRRLSVPDR